MISLYKKERQFIVNEVSRCSSVLECIKSPTIDVNRLPEDPAQVGGPVHIAVSHDDEAVALACIELLTTCGIDANLR